MILGAKFDEPMASDVDSYAAERGISKSAALRELVSLGLRALRRNSFSAKDAALAEMVREERERLRVAFSKALEANWSGRTVPQGLAGVGEGRPGRPRKG